MKKKSSSKFNRKDKYVLFPMRSIIFNKFFQTFYILKLKKKSFLKSAKNWAFS